MKTNNSQQDHPLIDSHCHLNMILEKELSQEEIFSLMRENQIEGFIQISTDPESIDFAQEKSNEELPVFYAYTIGHHPNEASQSDYQVGIARARECAAQDNESKKDKAKEGKKFAAIGEVGLDYYYTKEHREEQIKVFEAYLKLASEIERPVCIHTRDAHEDTLSILKDFSDGENTLIHCFTGNKSQMEDFLNIGCYISFSGIVTFKNAREIQEAALSCPARKLLVETDAPFLAPTPFRGKVNQPGYVRHTLNYIAELKKISTFELGKNAYQNTKKFYRLN